MTKIRDTDRIDKVRIVICFTGSVATVKIPELITLLLHKQYDVRLIGSGHAANHFLYRSRYYNCQHWYEFLDSNGLALTLSDQDEWDTWKRVGDPVLHIEVRRWADILIVVPASADTIAKISCGIADSFMLSVIRAWDLHKPYFLCPAMNTVMWNHPSTALSIRTLESWGWKVIYPVVKTLACNDTGNGALASTSDILVRVEEEASQIDLSVESRNDSNTLIQKIYDSKVTSNKAQNTNVLVPLSMFLVCLFISQIKRS